MVIEDQTYTFTPGETGTVPINTIHRFFNASQNEKEELVFEGRVEPAHESVHIIYGLDADGKTNEAGLPRSVVDLCLMGELGDMRWPGWMIKFIGNWSLRAFVRIERERGDTVEEILG